MPAKHISIPKLMGVDKCRIGDPPLSESSIEALNLYYYLTYWGQQYQLLSYSQVCDTVYGNGAAGEYYIILPPGPKADTGNPTRQLMAVIAPWCCRSATGEIVYNAEVKWQQSGGSEYTIFDRYIDSDDWLSVGSSDRDYARRLNINKIITLTDDDFNYTPSAGGFLTWGKLTVNYIMVAGMGVWICPDKTLTYDEARIPTSVMAPGKAIRGYESGEDPSLGELIHIIGDGDFDEDHTETQIRRVLFQWAHPQGIWCDNNSYESVFGNSTHEGRIYVSLQDYIGQGKTGSGTVYPAIICSGVGLASGSKAYVKMTSIYGGDTWIADIDSNSVAKYDYISEADTLTVDYPTDKIKVEAYCAETGDELLIHNISLFSGSGWNE